MNKSTFPQRPYRHFFREEWIIGLLAVLSLGQVLLSLHGTAGLLTPAAAHLSLLPVQAETATGDGSAQPAHAGSHQLMVLVFPSAPVRG